jgi:hypothetical protein
LHDSLNAQDSERTTVLIAPCIEGSEKRSIDGEGFPPCWPARQQMPEAPLVLACHDRARTRRGAADWLIAL